MKVEVIKCLSHSVELNFGETSVCITTDEAENLIAQLRAVVPVPSDVEEAAEIAARHKYPYEGGTKGAICQLEIPIYREGFKAGAAWQRNKHTPEDVQEAARAYSARVSNGHHFRDLETGYAAGMLAERERLMKDAVEVNVSNVGILQMGSTLTDKGIFAGDTIQVIIIKKEK